MRSMFGMFLKRGFLKEISFELQQEIYVLKQNSQTATELYSSLKVVLKEWEIYMPIPNCTWLIRCSCEAIRRERNNHNLLYPIKFLTGINEDFVVVKLQILLMDLFTTHEQDFSMVLQNERQGRFITLADSHEFINVVGYNKLNSKQGTSNSQHNTLKSNVCTHYGRTCHTIEVCYGKHNCQPHFCTWSIMLPQMMLMIMKIQLSNNQLPLRAFLQFLKINLRNQ